eukprot:12400005-Karenia_brevis.AAC.2
MVHPKHVSARGQFGHSNALGRTLLALFARVWNPQETPAATKGRYAPIEVVPKCLPQTAKTLQLSRVAAASH